MVDKFKGYYRFGIDVDGVLADFNTKFGEMLCHKAGRKFPSPFLPKSFQWYDELKLPKEIVAEGWQEINDNPTFWFNLSPLPTAEEDCRLIREFMEGNHEFYFLTARPYPGAKHATERWLSLLNIPNPTVLIVEEKGPVAKSLKLTHFLDDKPDNCYNVLRYCGTRTKVFLRKTSTTESFADLYVHSVQSFKHLVSLEKLHV